MLRRHSLGQKNLTASGQWGSLPGDTKDVMGVGFLAIARHVRFAGYLDDQLFRLNLNARNPGSNEAAVVCFPRVAGDGAAVSFAYGTAMCDRHAPVA